MQTIDFLSTYDSVSLIHEGKKSNIYRVSNHHEPSFIVKACFTDASVDQLVNSFEREYEATAVFEHPNIVKVLDKKQFDDGIGLILSDCGETALDKWDEIAQLPRPTKVEIMHQLALAVREVHKNSIIHKDINPSNIIYDHEIKRVALIDFGISSIIPRQSQSIGSPSWLEGSLLFMSPEQTGRMNRSIDYRTDFYSLGATFYWLLLGTPPFESEETLEVIHFHLAKIPVAPCVVDPKIPEPLSDIVMKLLAKNAEDRYQTGLGLEHDLNICLKRIKQNSDIPSFKLGQKDRPSQFNIPQKLYGRKKQLEKLLDTYKQVCKGESKIVSIVGYSGIGKTSLAKEVYRPVTASKGYYLSGKYDQFEHNKPYSALITVLTNMIKQCLAEDDSHFSYWRIKFEQALGNNIQVIINVIPDLELIVGAQPAVQELPPQEARSRFEKCCYQFISAMADKEHPIVFFIDDLQWADKASLHLIRHLIVDHKIPFLLLIFAYRDNEVTETHAWMKVERDAQDSGRSITTINLDPLNHKHINHLLGDTLKVELTETKNLAKLIHDKTQGNPFFITLLLKQLYSIQLIIFNEDDQCWQWDYEAIRQAPIADNVITLMIFSLEKLPSETLSLLSISSCIGQDVDISLLSEVCKKNIAYVLKKLKPAVISGFMHVPEKFAYAEHDIYSADNFTNKQSLYFRFSHDRVQQAANELLDHEKCCELRHVIAMTLYKKSKANNTIDKYIFDIVDHFNTTIHLIDHNEQWEMVVNLNLQAAIKAENSIAFNSALDFLDSAIKLLPSNSWDNYYDLSYDLHYRAIRSAYFCAEFDRMRTLAKSTLSKVNNKLQTTMVSEYVILGYFIQNRHEDVIIHGIPMLSKWSINLPLIPNKLRILKEVIHTRLTHRNKSFDKLLNTEDNIDPAEESICRIIMFMLNSAYRSNKNLFVVLMLIGVQRSIKYRYTSSSSYFFAVYSLVLSERFRNMSASKIFLRLSDSLKERKLSLKSRSRTFFSLGLAKAYFFPLTDSIYALKQGYESGIETGDMERSAIISNHYCAYLLFNGHPMEKLKTEIQLYLDESIRMRQPLVTSDQTILLQSVSALLSTDQNANKTITDDSLLELFKAQNNNASLYIAYCYKLMVAFWLDDIQQCLSIIDALKQCGNGADVFYHKVNIIFYESLALIFAIHKGLRKNDWSTKRHLNRNQEYLDFRAINAPNSCLHKSLLIKAETSRLNKQTNKAVQFYQEAISAFCDDSCHHERALILERASSFFLIIGYSNDIVNPLAEKAISAYETWGCKSRIRYILSSFNHINISHHLLYYNDKNPKRLDKENNAENPFSHDSLEIPSSQLDIASVVKASQSISKDIVYSSFIKNMMIILMESVGAERGLMLLLDDEKNEYFLEAEARIESLDDMIILQHTPLSLNKNISSNIVQYVIHSKNYVLLDSARENTDYAHDEYIIQNKILSVLCFPLVHHEKIVGLVYFENNNIEGSFTDERLNVLNVLSTQVAISIDNSKLYRTLEENNRSVGNLLAATKAMSGAKDNIQAIEVIIDYISDIGQGEIDNISVYFPQTDKQSILHFCLCADGCRIQYPVAELLIDKPEEMIFENNLTLSHNKIIMRTSIEQQLLAVLSVVFKEPLSPIVLQNRDYLSGLNNSLALRLDSLASEQDKRLSSIGAMAAGIVHDLKNPIGAILSYAELIEEEKLIEKEGSYYINVIKDEAIRLSTMAHEVLEFSSGNISLNKEPLTSTDFINRVTDVISATLNRSNITFIQRDEYQNNLYLDSERIRRVLLNLATNACDAMVNARTENPQCTLTLRDENSGFGITFSDNGPGIPKKIRATLFDPFVTSGKSNGTGLGMSIVKKTIDAHDGSIRFETTDKGTDFHMFFPQHHDNLSDKPLEITATNTTLEDTDDTVLPVYVTDTAHILIAEDNPVNQLIIEKQLFKMGLKHIVLVSSGADAVETVENQTIDLILMDVEMPDMDGIEASRIIRQLSDKKAAIPIIAITAHSDKESWQRCSDAGINSRIVKPVNRKALLKELNRFLAD